MNQPSITVTQILKNRTPDRNIYIYRVKSSENSTTPKIREELSEDQINDLIAKLNYKVKIIDN